VKKAILCLTIAIASSWADAASFDCNKAATYAEKAICHDAILGNLDEALSTNYRNMLTGDLGDNGKDLKQSQREWIQKRNRCTSVQCLTDAYRSRVDEICDIPVVRGIHPDCETSDDIK